MTNQRPKVVVVKEDDPRVAVRTALEAIRDQLPRFAWGTRIVVKPNLLATEFRSGGLVNTNPRAVVAVAQFLRDEFDCEVILGEGTTNSKVRKPDTLVAMRNHGYLGAFDWKPVDFNADDDAWWFPIESPGLEERVELSVASTAAAHPLVSVAKLKTHDVLGVTATAKNLMGALCRARSAKTHRLLQERTFVKAFMHGFGTKQPNDLPEDAVVGPSKVALAANLVRLLSRLRPAFVVLETHPAMEGDGPTRGTPVAANVAFASTSDVACDLVAAEAAGFDPAHSQYLEVLKEKMGLGEPRVVEIPDGCLDEFPKLKPHRLYGRAKFSRDERRLLRAWTEESPRGEEA
ncbi:MAG: hypothetical protein Kow0069_23170 [Promethearchaeota archaeon]